MSSGRLLLFVPGHLWQHVLVWMVSVGAHLVVPEHVLDGEHLLAAVVVVLAAHAPVRALALVLVLAGQRHALAAASLPAQPSTDTHSQTV